jgi:hypothetical protein
MILSVDLETTGIEGQIIEIAAVIENFDLPVDNLQYFHSYVLHPRYDFEIFAAQMNKRVIDAICAFHKGEHDPNTRFTHIDNLRWVFEEWVYSQGWDGKEVTYTGKNFATFDKKFLEAAGILKQVPMHRRVLDPGSMYWIPETDGDTLPSTETCLKRAGLDSSIKHEALGDARNVLRLVRRKI